MLRTGRPKARLRAVAACVLPVLLTTCQFDKLTRSPSPIATLTLTPGTVRDSVAVGSVALAAESVAVVNTGEGTLSWSARPAQGAPWLELSPGNGTAPARLRVMLDPAGLEAGMYGDTVVVTAENAVGSPARVPIEFVVHRCTATPVVPDVQFIDSLTPRDCGAPHRAGSFARLYGLSASAGDSISVMLSSTAFAGYVVLDSAGLAGAGGGAPSPPLAATGACPAGGACVSYQLLRSGTYLIEATSNGAGQTGRFALSVTHPRAPAAPDTLVQFARDSLTAIATGGTAVDSAVVLRGSVSDPDAGDTLRLQVEVRPLGTPFTGVPSATGTRVANGHRGFVVVTPLANNTGYHWQARTLDQTGRSSAWAPFGANPETSADLATAIPVPPAPPTTLAQLQSDGATAIGLGGTATGGSVALRAAVSDPNPGDALRLEVEVEPVGTAFTGIGTGSGAAVANGGTATAFIAGLSDNTAYHWQARVVDQTGRSSAWAPFGGNAEADADFRVAVAATQLVFSVQPSAATAGAAIAPAIQVTAKDALGNPVTSFSGNVTIAIANNAGGGTLSGTTTVAAVQGVGRFSTLSIDKVGTGYTLRASTATLTATSAPFSVGAAAATHLVFTVQPSSVAAGASIAPAVQVTARDAFNNTATSFTSSVTMALGANPGGGALSGTTSVTAASGVATFSTLSINKTGVGYTLAISGGGLGATSGSFDIVAAGATRLVFSVQPDTTTAGSAITPAVQVIAQDAEGNTATSFTGNVTVAIGTKPDSGKLSGTTTVAAVAGTATFSTLSINRSGTGYTLTAAASGLSGAASNPFNIMPGAATHLVFSVQPTNLMAGSIITPAVRLTAQDALDNTATAFVGNVAVAIGTNPGSATLSGTKSMGAVAGVATFGDLSLDKAATGYALTGAATSLTGATSAAFTVSAAAANHLVFTVQPSNAIAGAALTPAVQVTAQDGLGNPVTGFTGTVTVAVGNNPGSGTLAGTLSVAAVSGVATFANLTVNRVGTGYTLTAAGPGVTTASSAGFNITPGAASQLAFTVQPSSASAGAAITPAVQVTARDAQGNTATGFTGSVTVAVGTNAGGGTLSGTATVAAASGVATFSGLSINKTGTGYTLTGAATGLTGATSTAFNVTAGAATELVFTVQPSTTTAGATIAPAVQLTARDAQGNTATGFAGSVTVAIGTNPASGTLSGTTSVTAVAGVATFSSVSISKTGTGYTLTGAASGLSGATSSSFDITAGIASQLAFTVQPSNATAGATITPAVRVTARDAQGNTATGFTGNVTVGLGANPGGGALSGTATVAAVGGVATFAGISIDKAGTGYTLTAAASGLTAGTSSAFNITPGAAAQLAFTVQPTNATAGATVTPAVRVMARDAHGNTATGFTGNVTVAIGTNPGGGTLSGTTTVAAVAGVATFSGVSIDKTGAGYTVTAAVSGLTTATSAAFNITPGAAAQLAFTVQPATTTAGATITPAVQVAARDAHGNTATGFTGDVTMSVGTNPGGGTLSGTTTVAAVAGMATFGTLSLDKTGTGYTLTAAATGVTGATTGAFDITPGAATQLAFTVPPTNTTAGATISPAAQLTARDAQGNTATGFTGNVTVAIAANPGGGTLGGTTTVAAVAGVATFATLSIDRSGAGYSLAGIASSLSGASSSPFDVAPAGATQLAFTVQPSSTTAGASVTPSVVVTALDPFGNTDSAFHASVTLATGTNPGGGTLSGTATVAAVNGVATFSTLSLNKAGAGYTLAATATGLTAATSTAFTIAPGAATHLVFSVQPTSLTAGSIITPAVRLTAQDAFDNTAPDFTGTVAVAIGTNTGGATLSGTASVAAIGGVATFGDLSLDKAGTGYTLTGAAAGVTSATSAAFNVSAATANRLVFTVQPSNAIAGAALTPAVRVTAQDGLGNPVTGFTGTVTVALGNNPGSATLGGTLSVAAVSGVATFGNLSVNRVGTGYTLTAAGAGVTTASSAGFTVTPGAASQLAFTVQPSTTTSGATITPALEVTALDAQGNTATAFAGNVTVAIVSNPGGGTLSGTTTVAAVSGVATFAGLNINKTGAGYTLIAAASGLSGATSAGFNITPGAATQLVVTGQPSGATAGAAISPAVQGTARDAQGNTATGFTGTVTAALGTNPGGGALSGTTTVAAVNGVATFTTLSIDKSGTGYTLVTSASGLSGATTGAFNVTAGAATQLVFTVQPSPATAGAAISPAVQVTAQDALGNTDPLFAATVSVALGSNPVGGSLSGPTAVVAAAGVATFSGLSIDKAGTAYGLAASAAGVAGGTSAAFSITPDTATQLVFTVQPTNTAAGAAIAPAVQLTARDAQGNTATGFTASVTVALGANPGGGTLAGTMTAVAVSGVATFSSLSVDKSATGYTITGAATGLTGATSTAFDVAPGAATQLVFTAQPGPATAGIAITPPVQVTARDAQGNTAGFTGSVTVAIGSNPGGGTLSGTTTVAAVAGVATFANLSVSKTGTGYTLIAAATALSGATSSAFDVAAGAATQLVFTVQPTNTTAGAAITPAVQLTAHDAQGNTATGFTGSVTVGLGTNPGGGTLAGTATVAAVSGVATFSGLSINKTGTGYTLTGAASGLTGTTSTGFNVTPATASLLVFTVQPSNAAAGVVISPAVRVTAQDAQGNTATGFAGNVTVATGVNPGGGTLSGTTTVAAVNGVATFSGVSINKSGTGYTLTAAATGPSGATSAAFNITAAAATHLVFAVAPSSATAGATITPPVQATAQDALGNTDPTFTASVTVAIATNPGGGTLSGTTSVAAVSGVATFATLSLDKAGSGYTLTAAAAGLSGTTSPAFNIIPGAATQLVFTVQPATATAGAAITPAVQLTARDAQGNTATGFTGNVSVAIGANPGSGTLSGTATVAAVNGIATFAGLSINKAGTGYTLTAVATGLSAATSAAFSITAGAASQLAFTVQPSTTTAGAALTPALQLTAQDPQGNTAGTFTGSVTVAIVSNPGGGTLSGTTTVAAVNGVATFAGLSINKVGTGYTLIAAATGLSGATTPSFNITPAAATQLVITVQPTSATAGAAISPAVRVTAQDAFGNTATGFAGNVTAAIATNPGGGTLSGTATVAAVSGIATFSGLSINKTGTGYTLSAAATGLSGATSTAFNITPGTASQLTFTVQPSATTAGATITPALQVTALDALGNTTTAFAGNVTLAIATNPGAGTLSGTTTVGAVAGVATFAGLSITKSGAGYTLSAAATGVTTGTSAAFNITPGTASQLVFTLQPTNTTAGAPITPAVQLTVRDALDNVATAFTGNVTVAVGANPGGGTLAGTKTVAAVSGVATFSGLSIDKTGTGYTLSGAATGLTGATSAAFNITAGAATQLVFTVQPSSATAGAAIAPAVQLTARDAQGNTATGFTGNVTVAIGTNPDGGALSGTTTLAAVAGVATFATLSINRTGTGYVLTGAATGLSAATSAGFDITPGTATQLAFTVQPSNTTAGVTITPAVQLTARDALGNTATGFTANVTVAIGSNPGGGTLAGTTTVAAVAGVATFAGLSINKSGAGYTLTGAASGLAGATSAGFNITPGAASQLVFTVQPSNATAGGTITPAVQVTARDAQGNTATGFNGSVTAAIATNPGGGTLSGTASVAAVSGVATFSTLSINKSGTGYTLSAAATGLTGSTSGAFNIAAGAATHLVFTVPPSSATAGVTITPAVQATAQDALGNSDPTFTGSVTVAIGTNPGGGTLSGTASLAAVAGVATFATLSIDKAGTGYTLTGSATGLSPATSAGFNIAPGAATQLAFTAQPTSATAGAAITPAVQVTARDAQGNTATGFTSNVTVAIGTNPSSGTLSGTTTMAAVAGVATFSGLSINKSGTGYTLTAAATGQTGAASTTFNITPGAATQLVFTVQPSSATAGTAISPAIQVTAQDVLGNTATGFGGNVAVAIGTNAGSGTLSGTATVAAVSGIATFAGININKTGTGYTLTGAATGLTGATSAPFTITPGGASLLAFTVQPTTTTAGVTIAPAVQVTALDGQGNTATAFAGNVTVAIGTNPDGGALAGTTTVAAVSGVATFSTLSINRTGTGYTLAATAAGVTTGTSATFNITPGTATQLAFTVQPTNATAGAAIAPAVQVTARDAQGNTATGFTGNVTVAIGTNPDGGALFGTATVAAASGIATFAGLTINKTGTGYTLTASATSLAGASSLAFNITAGAASQLAFTVPPTNTTAGATITPAVQVTARDAQGNTASGYTGSVTVAIGTNPGGGTVAGTTTLSAVAGVATFSSLSINKTGTGYTLTAAATGLTGATSAAFNITPGAASLLVFTVQPTNTTAGATITPAVQVTARDVQGNTATGFTGNVTVAIGTNPDGGALAGTTTVAAVSGVASFSTLSVNKTGTSYTLAATAASITPGTSATFNITPAAASQLVFTVQPTNTTAGATVTPAVRVTAQDAQGNTATGFTGSVTVVIGTNAGGGTLGGTTIVSAVAGVATFSTLSVDKAGTGYTLSAAASGISPATSAGFDVTPGTAGQLAFTVQPTNTTAGATITPAVQVTARDAQGNTATGFTGSVTLTIGANPGSGTLTGTTTAAAVAGVATFSSLSIPKTGMGYTLTAAATGPSPATSAGFNVTPGTAAQLVFTVQPTSTVAGTAITPAVQVTARDAQGNTATAFTGTVTVATGANPSGGTLSGTTSVAAVAGVATFAGLSLDKSGTGYTLTAAASGPTGTTSASFNIAAGNATQLVFSVPPTATTAGTAISPAVQVTAQDALGNTATAFTGTVTTAIGSNPGGGTLGGTATVAAIAGVATFSTLSISKTGTGYTVTAAATGMSGATSAAFNITPSVASQLAFTVQPTGTVAGTAITPAVQVTALDAQGNTATEFTGNVTVAVATNPGSGTLAGTTTVAAVAGVASFSTLSIDKTGTGYTLAATAASVATGTSTPFDITAGTASQLVFTVPPSDAVAGATIAPAAQVTARDAQGNTATGFTGSVTVAIGTNAGGGTLSGTATVTAVSGVATFSTLSIDKMGAGYTLTATATGPSPATSAAFDITAGTASQLVFTVPPSDAVAGAAISPAVQITARDAQGNTVTGFTGSVTLAIGTNPGSGTLSGTTTVAAVAGVATFSGVSINRTGTGYTLTGAATGLSVVTSTAFNITPGTATQLTFTVQPTNTTAGTTVTPAVQVTGRDAQGNTATGFAGNVTVAIGTNAGGGTLAGTTTVAAVSGVATFSGLGIDKAGTGYTLTASATGLAGGTSAGFNILSGTAAQLAFTVQPSTTAAGTAISPAVQVTAQDAQGNTVAGFTGNVTVAIGTNAGGGTLSGPLTVAAVNGVATFSTLSIDKTGTDYTLTAATSGLSPATSAGFTVTPAAATQLVFTVQPSAATAGTAIAPAVQVTARDAQGNTATGFTGNVTVAIGSNPSAGTLSGTVSVAAVRGVASFSTLSINKAGSGYTLTVSATGVTGATSSAFNVTPGAATQLAFTAQPSSAMAGAAITPAVQVTAEDGLGNVVTAFSGNVTVTVGNNPGSSTLSGTATLAAVNGVATFSDLSLDKVGTGYTLTAAATSLTTGTSTAFNITPGPAAQLVFTRQPTSTTAGANITPGGVRVTARDAQGNTATSFTGNVTVAIGTNPGGGTLSGTTTAAASGGVAAFMGLSIDKSGTGYTLTAAATGLTTGTSAAFNITPASASQLVFTVQPSTTTAGATITPAVQLSARDGFGNTVTGFTGNVSIALGTNPGGGTLAGTKSMAAVAGVATFSGLSINRTGTGYTLTASAPSLTGATSTAFNITPGSASQLAFTVQPTNTTAGATIAPAVQVTARDAQGNTATGFSGDVAVATGANPGGGTLTGTTTVAAVSGVATFSTLTINKTGTGYTLAASAASLATGTSAAFNITPGTATHLAFTVQPSSATAGAAITPAVRLTALDGQGNTATAFAGNVTVAIATNPGGGTLSGTTTVAAVAGVATFSSLSINHSATGYTLTASAAGLTSSTSAAFDITVGAATQLAFTVQPSDAVAGAAIAPAVQVTARDAQGNTATGFTGNVTLAIGTNPGGGTLSGTTTVAAVAGVATFSGVSIDKAGTGYTLAASAAGLTTATSAAFNIAPGAASHLVFTVEPTSTTAGATISPALQVTARDAQGNTATGFTSDVTVAIETNPDAGTLTGTTTVAAVAGVATFSTLSINKTGTGYTLSATAASLTGATSAGFDITPGAASATLSTVSASPADVTASNGLSQSTITVTVRDGFGNPVSGATVTLAATGTGNALSQPLGATNGSGQITGRLSSTKAEAKTVTATVNGALIVTQTATVTVTSAAASHLALQAGDGQTATVGTAVATAPAVAVTDEFGNAVAGVGVMFAGTAGGGTVDPTAPVTTDDGGVAAATSWTLGHTAGTNTLTATSGTLAGSPVTFTATGAPGAAVDLVFTGQPTDTKAGDVITPAVVVTAVDAYGNTATAFTGDVSVSITPLTGTPGATLSGTITISAVGGVATFSDLSVDLPNPLLPPYQLSAASAALTDAASQAFDITP